MIQRIQSLFLLIVSVLMAFFYFTPYATFMVEPQMLKYSLGATGLTSVGDSSENIYSVWAVLILITLVFSISTISLFFYKKRMLQIRLCVVNIVLLLGLQGILWFVTHSISKNISTNPSYSIIFIFPLISAILTFLALRSIAKDEALVRSLDRIR